MNERLKPTDSRASRWLSCNHVGRAVQTDLNFWQIDWQSVSAQPNKHASQHLLYVGVFIWKPITGNQSALIHLYCRFQQLEFFFFFGALAVFGAFFKSSASVTDCWQEKGDVFLKPEMHFSGKLLSPVTCHFSA